MDRILAGLATVAFALGVFVLGGFGNSLLAMGCCFGFWALLEMLGKI